MAQTSEFLTANWIDRARPLKNQEQGRRDKDIPALFLRIRTEEEGGGKSWMLRYNDPVTGKRKSYALNGIPGTSQCWALAKEKAQEALRTIQLQMKTPREVAREEQELLRLKERKKKKGKDIKSRTLYCCMNRLQLTLEPHKNVSAILKI